MRSVAILRLVNFLTGVTPGRLFQISMSRWLLGPIRSANCTSVEKTPAPVSRATWRLAWTVMLFSASMVKYFIVVVLCAVITAVITFITPLGNPSKTILLGLARNLRSSDVVRLMIAGDRRRMVTAQNSGARKKKRF